MPSRGERGRCAQGGDVVKLILRTPNLRAQAIRAIQALPLDQVYECELKPWKATRSSEQNARMWAMLTEISEQVEWYGRKLTPEDWKHVFSSVAKNQDVVPGINGGFVILGYHTSKMTVQQMSDLMEIMAAFGAERGVKFAETRYSDYSYG